MSKYEYENLKDLSEKRDAYFYGMIVDSTFPCKEDESDGVFVTVLKVIDHSQNFLNEPELSKNMVYVVIKSDLFESLPFSHNIGDIIRVHRGIYVSLSNLEL